MFKRNFVLKSFIIALLYHSSISFMDISPTNDFESVAFEESIFKAYNSSALVQKEIKAKPINSKEIIDPGIEASSGLRDVRVLRSPSVKKKKRKTSLEKLLNVALSSDQSEDARKLVKLKCSNSIIRSYLHLDEEYPSNAHPVVADYEMVHICENNKTTCCNKPETFEIRKIFKEKQDKVHELLLIFKKVIDKLGNFH
jgi:hypothetical protein